MTIDDTPMSPKFLGRTLLRHAVQRQILDPFTGDILDIRRAVLADGTDHGHGMHVMTAANWDLVKDKLFSEFGKDNFDIYDGRELFA